MTSEITSTQSAAAAAHPGPSWWMQGTAVALVVLVAPSLVVTAPAGDRLGGLLDLFAMLAYGVAAACCLAAARRTRGRTQLGWALLGGALLLWFAADALWAYAFGLAGQPHAVVAHTLYILGTACSAVGLLLVPGRGWQAGVAGRAVLDAAVLALSLLLISEVVVFGPSLAGASSAAQAAVALVYPVSDLLLATLAFLVCRSQAGRNRPDLLLLTFAFGTWTLADTLYVVVGTLGHDPDGSPVSALYAYGAALVAMAALTVRVPGEQPPRRRLGDRLVATIPELVVLTAVATAMLGGLGAWHEWLVAALLGLVLLVRQTSTALAARQTRESLEAMVTERTEALQLMSERQARILDAAGEGILGLDARARVTFVNAGAVGMLGWAREELLGRPVCEALCASAHTPCPHELVVATGQSVREVAATYRRQDGTLLPVEVTVAPQGDPEQLLGAVVAFRDVSDRQAVEQLKQQFVSAVSHELRTPLTAIRGVLEVLADGDAGPLPEVAQRLVGTAERGVHRLSRLVDDIIDVEKLATGDFSVVPRPTGLRPVLADAVASLQPLSRQTGVEVRLAGAEVGEALCDPDRVEQALVNLIGNAVKFSPVGSTVEVSAEERPTEIEVAVRDHGRGIPVEEVEHVFERFHQVATTDATEKGGTGLGLTITRSIVERHGGRIWVESAPGQGATFRFTLPTPAPSPTSQVRGRSPSLA